MKLKIDNIERECQIMPAPNGTFADYGETFGFPTFVIFAPSIGKEVEYGDVVVCPIDCMNGGLEAATPATLYNELYINKFKEYIEYRVETWDRSERDAADYIISSMKRHNVIISSTVNEYYNKLITE